MSEIMGGIMDSVGDPLHRLKVMHYWTGATETNAQPTSECFLQLAALELLSNASLETLDVVMNTGYELLYSFP